MEVSEQNVLPSFPSDLSEADVVRILSAPRVCERLGDRLRPDPPVASLGGGTFQVSGTEGDLIVRFPGDAWHLSMLKVEERVQGGLRDWVTLHIPATRVVDDLDGIPPFAVHRMIPGQPLTTDRLNAMSPGVHDRLVVDLASFFRNTHSIPLHVACEWLGIPFDEGSTVIRLAEMRGKPTWFSPDAAAEMRPKLLPLLDSPQRTRFEETVQRFEVLQVDPDNMVFGHGDLHGYNVALVEDSLGLKLSGVFDLGCAGILDIHEDFFRLSLIGEGLLEEVIQTYQGLSGRKRTLSRERIAVYYRAFLFHLMVGKSGESLSHLAALLDRSLAYEALHGSLGGGER